MHFGAQKNRIERSLSGASQTSGRFLSPAIVLRSGVNLYREVRIVHIGVQPVAARSEHGHARQRVADPEQAASPGRLAGPRLTPREMEVARLLTLGLSDAGLAARLHISVRTASKHVEHLREKLELRSRWQVAEWAREQGSWDPS
ncbi:MAG: response regulator transcription factor [Candidatus Dormibacteria bacterium]